MPGIEFNGTDLIITPNGFSTENRYIREVANTTGASWMVEGPSMSISVETIGQSSYNWRFEVGPYTVAGGAAHPPPAAGFAIDKAVKI